MLMHATLLPLLLLSLASAGLAHAKDLTWGGSHELAIPLRQEQVISVRPASNIEIGVPAAVDDKLDIVNLPGRLSLTARQEFAEQRFIVKHKDYGSTVLKVRTAQDSPPKTYALVLPQASPPQTTRSVATPNACQYTYATAVRWAMHNLYAPERVIDQRDCFRSVYVERTRMLLFACQHTTLCGNATTVTPLASWSARQGLWVHALKIKNNTARKSMLDPRDTLYSKDFLAISFSHDWLGATGSPSDNTTAVLLTKENLASSLNELHRYSEERRQ